MGVRQAFAVIGIVVLLSSGFISRCAYTGITLEEDSKISPSHPTQVTVQIIDSAIELSWLGTGDDRIQHYRIYRKTSGDKWRMIGEAEPISDNRGIYKFKDPNIKMGVAYIYGISAVDTYGNESTISESSKIFFQ